MRFLSRLILTSVCTTTSCLVFAAGPTNSPLPGSSPVTIQPLPSTPKPQPKGPVAPYVPLYRPPVPPMEKPFSMPGVVGLNNGKWEGTDYLGHLSNAISVDVEVLKGENSIVNIDTQALQNDISDLLKKADITPKAQVLEGPPLPFLHILVIVYPVDREKFVIFCTCRLFEQIQVVRKNFQPAGYWQGITWENQDISLAPADQVQAKVKASTESLLQAFIERYRLYNRESPPK